MYGKAGVLDSRTNRAMLASLTFEPKQAATAVPPTEPMSEEPMTKKADEPNDATKKVIRCMKLALSKSIAGISMPGKFRPLNPRKDFEVRTKLRFGQRGGGCGVCGGGTGVKEQSPPDMELSDDDDDETDYDDVEQFTFFDYSPMCYRHIRSFFDVDATSYRDVLCNSGWHSIPTPGKSAAQLFFCGQNWVIKTMTNDESDFLCSILHKYYYHIRDNPHTLLPHFVGHHRIEFEGGDKISFIIMQNVFATPLKIHEKFDLKGSTVGRFATKEEKKKQTCTKKDLDINRPLVLGDVRRKLLIDQIKRDCDFLKKASIMDYSFLVGIHHVASASRGSMGTSGAGSGGSLGSTRKTLDVNAASSGTVVTQGPAYDDGRCFTSDSGGMLRADDGNGQAEVYYVGIIDILQEYTLWKRSETFVRGITNDRTQISSVDPRDYASRFVSFMSSFIV